MADSYFTISKKSEGDYRDKGSRFLAYAFPVKTEQACKSFLDEVKMLHPKARHICYAFTVEIDEPVERTSDAGEPSGTAGKTILGQIHSHGLENILIVIARYFGGTLLGVPGLIHAYRSAAADAIARNEIFEKKVRTFYRLEFDYADYHPVMNLLNKQNVEFIEQKTELDCLFVVSIERSRAKGFEQILGNFEKLLFTFLYDE